MNKYVAESRKNTVRAMDEIVRNFNDEDIIMTWLSVGVPDDADDDDYAWFAENDDEFADLVKLFFRLFRREYRDELGVEK